MKINYTITDSPIGYILAAATGKGICSVKFGRNKTVLKRELEGEFRTAQLTEAGGDLKLQLQPLLDYLEGRKPWPVLPIDVKATAFQRRVWKFLRTIPPGKTCHYSEVAAKIGHPKAVRAVARACASNRLALVIPCHRIVPKSGGVGGFRWDPKRKEKLLALERNAYLPHKIQE